jgi:hypothetical protein
MTILVDGLSAFGSLAAFIILALIIRVTFRRGRGPGDI